LREAHWRTALRAGGAMKKSRRFYSRLCDLRIRCRRRHRKSDDRILCGRYCVVGPELADGSGASLDRYRSCRSPARPIRNDAIGTPVARHANEVKQDDFKAVLLWQPSDKFSGRFQHFDGCEHLGGIGPSPSMKPINFSLPIALTRCSKAVSCCVFASESRLVSS
jgi:hypothetical protein